MENGQLVGLQPNWSVLDMADSHRVMSLSGKAFHFDTESTRQSYLLFGSPFYFKETQ